MAVTMVRGKPSEAQIYKSVLILKAAVDVLLKLKFQIF